MTEFKLSRYVKEELPTWAEMHEWYQNKFYTYVPTNHHYPLNPYWKIPQRLYTLASMCNQLNKMLIEDDYRIGLIDMLSIYFKDLAIDDVYFAIDCNYIHNPDKNTIYTWDTKPNPFIQDTSVREMLEADFSVHRLHIKVHYSIPITGWLREETINELYDRIIDFMFAEIERYYQEPIGWKDVNGNPLPYRQKPFGCPSGVDPAL